MKVVDGSFTLTSLHTGEISQKDRTLKLTPIQIKVIFYMHQNREQEFSIYDAIKLLGWKTTYGDPYKKFRLPFYNMMSRLEEKGLVRRPIEMSVDRTRVSTNYILK